MRPIGGVGYEELCIGTGEVSSVFYGVCVGMDMDMDMRWNEME
jgi:hypothetical protein